MDLDLYQQITGILVPEANQAKILAIITKVRLILETKLGFTLDPTEIDTNEYTEIGKTPTECPCPEPDPDTLLDPDDIEFAYRLYDYNPNDKYLSIDPCTAVHAVKLVKDGVTYKTLNTDEYRAHSERGVIKYLEQCEKWCVCKLPCNCTQLAVDAEWIFQEDVADDLLQVWAEMVTFYADIKKDIKSQALGPHSYTKFDNTPPEEKEENINIIKRYVGPNGSMHRTITI